MFSLELYLRIGEWLKLDIMVKVSLQGMSMSQCGVLKRIIWHFGKCTYWYLLSC